MLPIISFSFSVFKNTHGGNIMKHLIEIIKQVELDIRSSNQMSRGTLEKLTELSDWDYKIVQDAILRIRMFVQSGDPNFVYKYFENIINDYSFYKHKNYKPVDLLIACLRRDQFDTSMTDAYNRLYCPNEVSKDVLDIWGLPVTQARNLAVKEALKRNAKFLLFIDDDIVAPNNALVKLLDLQSKYPEHLVYAGEYYKKLPGIDKNISAHDYNNNIRFDNRKDIRELDLCAMGFTLIDIDIVSQKVPFPLFWEFGAPDGYWSMGEDAFFTKNLFEYCKVKPLLDKSIKLLHYDKIWKRMYGERDKKLVYATNKIVDLDHFERLRVPEKYPHIGICIPTRDKSSPLAVNLNKLPVPRGYRTSLFTVSNLLVDEARINLVQQCLDNDCDYVLFIDDDIVPPIDGLFKLVEHIEKDDIDIISGDYPLKGLVKNSIHLQLDSQNMVQELERCDTIINNNLQLVKNNWIIGLGFCLIDINFFKQAQPPWFKCHSKNPVTENDVNEDAHFSELAHQNGFNIYIDRSLKCLHLDFQNQIVYSLDDTYDISEYAGFDRT